MTGTGNAPRGRFAHITRGKVGSQWVRDVLGDPEILAAQGLRLRQPGAWYDMRAFASEPDGTLVAPLDNVSAGDWLHFRDPADRCVVVVRDPRDALVSWAFSMAYSHVSDDRIALIRPPMLSVSLRGKLEIAAYVAWVRAPMSLSWAELREPAGEMIVRFEDLIADEGGTFASIVSHFGWDVSGDVLRRVVDRHTFARRSGGRERGESDLFSHYRNAVAGDWKNYLDRDLARRFELTAPGYTRRLGYERSDDWWMEQPETLPALDARDDATQPGAPANDELERARADLDAVRAAAERLLDRLAALESIDAASAER
ncbi:MAG: hypothetical protein QOF71_2167 [Candidatus Eremiobacteraeota bacterium]|jgi:hypothetical protein|nr:hypothetical protein [Candidatus Eremiobacteraeota bacterium]